MAHLIFSVTFNKSISEGCTQGTGHTQRTLQQLTPHCVSYIPHPKNLTLGTRRHLSPVVFKSLSATRGGWGWRPGRSLAVAVVHAVVVPGHWQRCGLWVDPVNGRQVWAASKWLGRATHSLPPRRIAVTADLAVASAVDPWRRLLQASRTPRWRSMACHSSKILSTGISVGSAHTLPRVQLADRHECAQQHIIHGSCLRIKCALASRGL